MVVYMCIMQSIIISENITDVHVHSDQGKNSKQSYKLKVNVNKAIYKRLN